MSMPEISFCLFDLGKLFELLPKENKELKAKIAEYPVDPHGRPFSLDIPPNPSPSTKCDKKVLQNE